MPLIREWFSAGDIADHRLPGVPTSKQGVLDVAQREGWTRPIDEGTKWRKREGRGGGVEFHVSLLPPTARVAMDALYRVQGAASTRSSYAGDPARDALWTEFWRMKGPKKTEAVRRLTIITAVEDAERSGMRRQQAISLVCSQYVITEATFRNWEGLLRGVPQEDRLAHLAPKHKGSTRRRECPDDAWNVLRADYLRPEKPSFESCWRRLEGVAKARGWQLPSKRTLARRIEEIPEAVQVAAREGTEALKRLYPAQERTRAHFHALEAVNADGHKWDVFVRWPDGYVGRPLMIAFQDLFSGKILSWRIDKTENKEATRLAFGDLVEEFGIPDKCWLDNGRQFASKWITGGSPNRYRFKIKDDEPLGLLVQLGVEVHWTTPYAGQSKPIERAFRDFAGDTAKHPRFAGAYTGNNPLAKPENYGNAAVPLDVFLATLAEAVAEHNSRPGRDTAVCNGRSFDAAFAESYATAPIRKAAPMQRQLWLLAAESLRCSQRDGLIALEGNQFWAEFLTDYRGQRVTCRFDPQALQDDLHVYALDGRYLGAAPCLEAVGFDNADAAREHARARKAWMRATRMQLAAEKKLSIEQVAAMLPSTQPAAPPQSKVVRPVFGNAALKPRDDALPEQSDAEIRLLRAVRSNAEALRRQRHEGGWGGA